MKKGTNTWGTNWQVFMECHTSAIVMKEILFTKALLSTLASRKCSLLWILVVIDLEGRSQLSYQRKLQRKSYTHWVFTEDYRARKDLSTGF